MPESVAIHPTVNQTTGECADPTCPCHEWAGKVSEAVSEPKIDSSPLCGSGTGISDSSSTALLPDFDSDWQLAPRTRTAYVEESIAHYWWLRGRQAGIEESIRLQNEDLREAARLRGLAREAIR